ncbi:MAG: bifunctional demethylmenaquinone methyltransferase/2-methoxy-6-polyprenyl-1,4-benzoquinol methylase UbiE [Candidatus Rokubacteria bacterium]|nr:bifunctional demethylmenaquinone methyltransferase/2-methoxy-6-polyprenyl-1,4-benzoquinol methylase UbiE [Candidatus Rokubacteria bacterium]
MANQEKARYVREMFTRIAHRYDLMNGLMTLGRDQAWRRIAVSMTDPPGGLALDVATGTGDLALALLETSHVRRVVGLDFSEGMLRVGRAKLSLKDRARRVSLVAGDALALPFRDATFACVTSAFLLRNLADLEQGLAEMRRVTRPGGRVMAIEITQPTLRGFGSLFRWYFHGLVPRIGRLVSGDAEAYSYLPQSVDRFLPPAELAQLMESAGFREVRYRRVGIGTVTIHVGSAPVA